MVSQSSTNNEISQLSAVYRQIDLPVDQFAVQPAILLEFSTEMGRRGFPWTPEVTLAKLFRARKSGKLPKIRRM